MWELSDGSSAESCHINQPSRSFVQFVERQDLRADEIPSIDLERSDSIYTVRSIAMGQFLKATNHQERARLEKVRQIPGDLEPVFARRVDPVAELFERSLDGSLYLRNSSAQFPARSPTSRTVRPRG